MLNHIRSHLYQSIKSNSGGTTNLVRNFLNDLKYLNPIESGLATWFLANCGDYSFHFAICIVKFVGKSRIDVKYIFIGQFMVSRRLTWPDFFIHPFPNLFEVSQVSRSEMSFLRFRYWRIISVALIEWSQPKVDGCNLPVSR